MSLSFVSSAVQTGTADGGYEEKAIESKEVQKVNLRNQHKPLFEQLRENQEEEQAKQEEIQREMMRGTRALDEEDVAHLDALEKQREERERAIQMRTQDELAMFRAARVERQQISLQADDDDEEKETEQEASVFFKPKLSDQAQSSNIPSEPSTPKIVVKKRKRRVDSTKEPDTKKKSSETPKDTVERKEEPTGGLGGLLCGYGSSDDESD